MRPMIPKIPTAARGPRVAIARPVLMEEDVVGELDKLVVVV